MKCQDKFLMGCRRQWSASEGYDRKAEKSTFDDLPFFCQLSKGGSQHQKHTKADTQQVPFYLLLFLVVGLVSIYECFIHSNPISLQTNAMWFIHLSFYTNLTYEVF